MPMPGTRLAHKIVTYAQRCKSIPPPPPDFKAAAALNFFLLLKQVSGFSGKIINHY